MGSVLYSEVPLRMFYCVQNIIGPSTTSRPHFSLFHLHANNVSNAPTAITPLTLFVIYFSVLTPHPPLS